MASKIIKCSKSESTKITQLNPEIKETIKTPLCRIDCMCDNCGFTFTISSWTNYGKNKGILY
jgi:hypothetical protein